MSKYYLFNNGYLVPSIGLGTWQSPSDKVYNAVKYAVEEVGYRHIDCAPVYANEKEVGIAVKDVIEKGVIGREDLFITTKCWNTHHSRSKVVEACEKSIKDLNALYIDLYLIHSPIGFKEGEDLFPKNDDGTIRFSDVDYLETWKGMEDCVNNGLVKSIGLSNFNAEQISRIINNCAIKPVMLQVECHPYFNQSKLIEFCMTKEILVTAFGALGSPQRPWLSQTDTSLLEEPLLGKIGQKYKKTIAQVLIRYQLQRGVVVIPKSINASRIKENFDVFDFNLSFDEMKSIDSLDRNRRLFELAWCKVHKYYPYNISF